MQQCVNLLISQNVIFAVYFIPVLVVKKVFAGKLSANVQYYIWLPFILHLLFPVSLFPAYQATVFAFDTERFVVETPSISLLAIWIAGTTITTLCFLLDRIHFRRVIAESQFSSSTMIKSTYADEYNRLKIKSIPSIVQCSVSSPALYGLFRQVILLPEDIDVMEQDQIRHILTHELIHHKKGDPFICALLNLLCAVCWFNPIVWLAARCIRNDMELACDESLLINLGRGEFKNYGETLIEYASHFDAKTGFSLSPGFGNKFIKKRIASMKRVTATPLTLRMFGVIAILTLLLFFCMTGFSFSSPSSIQVSSKGGNYSNSEAVPSYSTR